MDDLDQAPERREDGDFLNRLRARVQADTRAWQDPTVQRWCGLRFRDLFLREAVADPAALAIASRGKRDPRPARRRIAERFLVGEGIETWRLELPAPALPSLEGVTILFCPGLLTGLLPVRGFESVFPVLESHHGWRCLRADCHPLRGCAANGEDISRAVDLGLGRAADGTPIPETQARPPGDLLVIAYSKGGPDVLTLLAHRRDLWPRVRCLFALACPFSGSPVADGVWEKLDGLGLASAEDRLRQLMGSLMPKLERSELLRRIGEIDVGDAVHDLTTPTRIAFLDQHRELLAELPFPVFTIAGSTTLLEVPWYQASGYLQLRRLDPHNDMQVTSASSRLPSPMAVDLGCMHSHHWDIAYGAFPKPLRLFSRNLTHPLPKQALVTAMAQLAGELGLLDP